MLLAQFRYQQVFAQSSSAGLKKDCGLILVFYRLTLKIEKIEYMKNSNPNLVLILGLKKKCLLSFPRKQYVPFIHHYPPSAPLFSEGCSLSLMLSSTKGMDIKKDNTERQLPFFHVD